MRLLLVWFLSLGVLESADNRIASFSPGATQTLLDLGCSAEIVAATRWCPLPKEHPASRTCDVFQPDLEKLLLTKPTLVILPRMANPLWADKCTKAGLRTIVLHPESKTSCSQDIQLLGEATGRTEAAEKYSALLKSRPAQPGKKIIIVWDGVMAGPESYLAEPMAVAGFISALPRGSWVKFDWELLTAARPDAILWIQNNGANSPIADSPDKVTEMAKIPSVKDLPCLKARRIYQGMSGNNWLPGSGLTKILPELARVREILGP
jgi:ABC-type Fe3+-hydroxamate transport system substrate-binding protein